MLCAIEKIEPVSMKRSRRKNIIRSEFKRPVAGVIEKKMDGANRGLLTGRLIRQT